MNQSKGTGRNQTRGRKSRRANTVQNTRRNPRPTLGRREIISASGQLIQRSVASAYSTGQSTNAPKITRGQNSCTIVHRELVDSITGSTAFTCTSYAVNPGIQRTFPWLFYQALGWEKYRFKRIKFSSFTRTGSTTPGSLLLAPDFDAADAAPVNEQIASSYSSCSEDVPWKDIHCILPSNMINVEKYVRSAPVASTDIKTYDLCNLQLCTVDGTAVNWGKLWVDYEIELINPQAPPTGIGASSILSASNSDGTALTPALPFGTGTEHAAGVNGLFTDGVHNYVYFSNAIVGARYQFTGTMIGTGFTAFHTSGSTPGMTLVSPLSSDCYNAAETYTVFSATYNCTAASGSFQLTVTGTTVTTATCTLTMLPSGSPL